METEQMSGRRWVLTVGIPGLLAIFLVIPAAVAVLVAVVRSLLF